MADQPTPADPGCPDLPDLMAQARQRFDAILGRCGQADHRTFAAFEGWLWLDLCALACCLTRVFLVAAHRRLDLGPYLAAGTHRLSDPYARRRLRTRFGEVGYGRHYLAGPGGGFHPLDVELGLTRDGFSPGVISLVCRLATR